MNLKMKRNPKTFYRAPMVNFLKEFCRLKLPRLLSDGMVLQRDAPVRIWGWGEPGRDITVRFCGITRGAVTDIDGQWAVVLDPLKAGGPFILGICSGNQVVVVKNILIGDVWICSGQSNMVFPMARADERYAADIADSDNPFIRQFIVPDCWDFEAPRQDVGSSRWELANPETILQFSAVGYFFAKTLYNRFRVPIGLVKCCVGGSPVEAWMSGDALKAFPEAWAKAEKFKNRVFRDEIETNNKTINDRWYDRLNSLDQGLGKEGRPWFDPDYDAAAWSTLPVPSYWSDEGLGEMNGSVWFRKEIDLPASLAGKPGRLYLGCIVDSDTAYVNGVLVGSVSYRYPPRRYNVPENVLKADRNIIVIRVVNTSGKGGFVPDKPYHLRIEGQIFDLKGWWGYQVGAVMEALPEPIFFNGQPLGLYNGMLAPLLNYGLKGVIWYQAESNDKDPSRYHEMFPALIADWRQKWGRGDFPFLFVQLPNFGKKDAQPSDSPWAILREAQLKTLAVPNTGMAVAIDAGEWNDLHPTRKKPIGQRLALLALKVAYGDPDIVAAGPIFQSMRIEGQRIIITFSNIGSGLIVNGGDELNHFAVAGADGRFVWAQAVIQNNQVVVWSRQVSRPVAVRYAWADNPESANLYNAEMLPASPFRTDGPF